MMRLITFIFAAFAGMFAIFLRFGHGHPLRHAITDVLGYDGRAALEHMLVAFGLSLLCGMMLNVGYAGSSPANVSTRHKKSSMLYNIAQWDDRAPVALIAVIYLLIQFIFECYQAISSVYGGPARGYIQYEQVMADALGCYFAYVLIARISIRRNALQASKVPR